MKIYSPFLVSFSLLLLSCAGGGLNAFRPKPFVNPHDQKVENLSDDEALGVSAISASGQGGGFEANFTGNQLVELEQLIIWAPENPDENFELGEKGVKNSKNYDTWTKNYKKAIAEARKTGKPLLIWFTDSQKSYISRKLSNELFSKPDFDKWVRNKYTTLVVDKAIDQAKLDKYKVVRLKQYYEKMADRFSVKGTPEVLVVDVKGEIQARYRGYTAGEAEFYWGRLKTAHQNASQAYGSWKENLERKGYRMWHSSDGGKKVFAKMTSLTDEKVTLITPEGKRYSEQILKFSAQDQAWIESQ